MDILAEFLESDGFSVESSDGVNNFPNLFLGESVFELVIYVLKLIDGEFSSALEVVQAEVGTSSLFAEWVSLR